MHFRTGLCIFQFSVFFSCFPILNQAGYILVYLRFEDFFFLSCYKYLQFEDDATKSGTKSEIEKNLSFSIWLQMLRNF